MAWRRSTRVSSMPLSARTDILVGLLPLTPETTGLYNSSLFSRLRRGGALGKPVFINAGRGKSQVQADIVSCD